MRQMHDPNSEDAEERLLHDLQNLGETLQTVIAKAPELAPAVGPTIAMYHEVRNGDLRRDIGFDVDRLLEMMSALATGYRNALFVVGFRSDESSKTRRGSLDEKRVRNLLADIIEMQIDGALDLDRVRDLKLEARALLTGDDGGSAIGH